MGSEVGHAEGRSSDGEIPGKRERLPAEASIPEPRAIFEGRLYTTPRRLAGCADPRSALQAHVA